MAINLKQAKEPLESDFFYRTLCAVKVMQDPTLYTAQWREEPYCVYLPTLDTFVPNNLVVAWFQESKTPANQPKPGEVWWSKMHGKMFWITKRDEFYDVPSLEFSRPQPLCATLTTKLYDSFADYLSKNYETKPQLNKK